MIALRETWYMTLRHLLSLWRQPWWVAITLVQPVIWLLLFGALFRKVVEIPGFDSGSYVQFLAPGVVVMTATFSAGWSGMALIDDLNRGVLDRFLISPVGRVSLISGRILQSAMVIVLQSLIIIVLALAVGATFPNGVGGVAGLVVLAALLGAAFSALSNGLALLVRREETLIAVMNFLLLPLTFLSSTFMQKNLMPQWMQYVSDFNPVNWAVQAGRAAVIESDRWGFVAARAGLLLAVLILCGVFATQAFKSYQRSV